MSRRANLTLVAGVIAVCAIVTVPLWGMVPAVFLDSERTVVSRSPSPDGRRIAQVERIIVGGEPTIIVMVRSWWMPDWYLAGEVPDTDEALNVIRQAWERVRMVPRRVEVKELTAKGARAAKAK